MARPKNTKKDRIPILDDEFTKIIFLTKRDKSMKSVTKKKLLRAYTLLYCTGARISEISKFTLEDIQYIYKYNEKIITKTKTGATQKLVINEKAIQLLKDLPYDDCKEYLFYANNKPTPMSVAGLTDLINDHLKEQLNILYTTHSFRAGYITRIVETTGNPKIAQKLARHKNITTTLNYVGVSDKQIDDALNKIF